VFVCVCVSVSAVVVTRHLGPGSKRFRVSCLSLQTSAVEISIDRCNRNYKGHENGS
jgi:hypothetical protein